jgi:predicted  nucleic acid-binding Zn-ribbon protein
VDFDVGGGLRCLKMKVRIIEKIYHQTNSPMLSTPYRTDIELFWIKELGTAMPDGCNYKIKGVGNLSSPGCSEINVMSLFNTIPITKRSHGHKRIHHPNVKKSSKPRTFQNAFNDLFSNIQKPLGIHHIRTILFSLPVNYLKDLRDFGLDKGGVDPFSPKYRLFSIIYDVASFRLFKPIRSEPLHDNSRKFLHIPFANKGIDAINISNILNRKEVVKEIPPYFKNQPVPIVSYSYTNSIDRKISTTKKHCKILTQKSTLRTL